MVQRKDWCIAQAYSTNDLQRNDSEHEILGQRFWPAELGYLYKDTLAIVASRTARVILYFWVCFDDRLSPCPMRLLGIRPKEVVATIACCRLLGKTKR